MVPLSAIDHHAVEPDGSNGPVYLVAPLSHLGRARYQRDLIAGGGLYPSDDELARAVFRAAEEAGDPVRDEAKPDGQNFGALVERYRANPIVASVIGQRVFASQFGVILAARYGLRGWEKRGGKPEIINGLVTETCLDTLPETHVVAIGIKVMALMKLDPSAEKNFASPRPS